MGYTYRVQKVTRPCGQKTWAIVERHYCDNRIDTRYGKSRYVIIDTNRLKSRLTQALKGADWRGKFVASQDFNIPKGYDFSIHACPYI